MKDTENLLDSLLLIKRRLVNSLLGNQAGAAAFASDLGQRVEEEAATLSRLHLDKRISMKQLILALRNRTKASSSVAAAAQA